MGRQARMFDLDLGSKEVLETLETLEELMAERGAPSYTRSDNGPEFIASTLEKWLREKGVKPLHIEPGSPWHSTSYSDIVLAYK